MNAALTRMVRTLLVDDVEDLRTLIRITLENSGRFTVAGEAKTGREGIEKARALQPDLVLLDLSMPEMDGLEALPQILAAAPGARVVVFSGFHGKRLAETALELGAVDYLEKGIEPDELVTRLLAILEPDADDDIEIDLTSSDDDNEGEATE